MIEKDIDIPTADGAMNSFVVHPEEGGPFPVVFFLMDAPGKREELHDMGDENLAVWRTDIVIVRLDRDVHPVLEVVRPVFGVNGSNVSLVEEGEGAAHRRDLHRLKDPVEDEDVAVPRHDRRHGGLDREGAAALQRHDDVRAFDGKFIGRGNSGNTRADDDDIAFPAATLLKRSGARGHRNVHPK